MQSHFPPFLVTVGFSLAVEPVFPQKNEIKVTSNGPVTIIDWDSSKSGWKVQSFSIEYQRTRDRYKRTITSQAFQKNPGNAYNNY